MAVTINGSTGVQLDDNDKQKFGTGDDLEIFHDGSTSYIDEVGTGILRIRGNEIRLCNTSNETYFTGTENGSASLYYDDAKKFETTATGVDITGNCTITGNFRGNDDIKLNLGNSDDLQIYHDGSNSYIKAPSGGTGDLLIMTEGKKIKLTPKNGDEGVVVVDDGAVELYHDGTKKLETASPGIRVAMQTWGSDPSASNAGAVLGSPNSGGFICAAGGTTDSDHALFINPNGIVGRIRTNGSGTSFNTSSDYRLKENQVAISDGITRLKQLKPYRFNFKADASKTVDGFFAHEVTPAVPEAVTGEKDAVELEDNDKRDIKKGDIIPQGIDQSKLVPLLTAALQEAITEIETLKTKVAALEAA